MKRHYGTTKTQQQANWLAEFSDALGSIDTRYSGRIAWDAANHLRNIGLTPIAAAQQYAQNPDYRKHF